MIKGMLGDDSMSNLTSASNEASISSTNNRIEIGSVLYPQLQNIQTQPPPNKKKRNLPGNPVQSDWKAHSKICGTREYRCDCGTLFSRRDSFITHRAFCDALTEESSRTIIPPPNSSTSHHLNLHTLQNFQMKQEQQQSNDLSSQLFIQNPNSNSSNIFGAPPPHMSATALLQKAAQIGVTSSSHAANNNMSANTFFSPTTSTTTGMAMSGAGAGRGGGGDIVSCEYHPFENNNNNNNTNTDFVTAGNTSFHDFGASVNPGFMEQVHDMQNMMATTAPSLPCTSFDEGFGHGAHLMRQGKENNEGLTRDFLGLRAFPHHRDFLNTTTTPAVLHYMGSSSSAAAPASFDQHHLHQNQNQSTWQN
ncbi:hypothetical protein MTR67_035721 [Solanum verrucosum]|uniref:BIRD-IDD transcription factor fourth C2HC zinc finger domain-containing protein n=1 Tax=Solanum verrucosum TaxID=315347 RepID=A0AAF0UAX3_SOLVR|nr:hypothetical protein MTR67_035721 [Solanum verrucosum]